MLIFGIEFFFPPLAAETDWPGQIEFSCASGRIQHPGLILYGSQRRKHQKGLNLVSTFIASLKLVPVFLQIFLDWRRIELVHPGTFCQFFFRQLYEVRHAIHMAQV